MRIIDLNKDWFIFKSQSPKSFKEITSETEKIDLPFDILPANTRVDGQEFLKYNGYYNSDSLTIIKELPRITKAQKVYLDISGVSGTAAVFINETCIKSIAYPAPYLIDITEYILNGANFVKIAISSYSDSGKYTGLGIAGSVKLMISESAVALEPYGVFIRADKSSAKAAITIKATVRNDSPFVKQLNLAGEIFNHKQKRIVKKIRKIKIAANSIKEFELSVKLARFFMWDIFDPYIYSCKVSLCEVEKAAVLDFSQHNFGISSAKIENKALTLNGNPLKLKGAVVMHDCGILGNASELSAEMFKLSRIKELGFNAVRYIGCPSDAALCALDTLGLMCVVDIFDIWKQGKFVNDGHMFFDSQWEEVVKMSVLALRNHPSVIMYSIGNNVEESYGRGGGVETAKNIIAKIKEYDKYRLITGNAFERIPTSAEIEKNELKIGKTGEGEAFEKKALSAAREKDLFKSATDSYFSLLDVAGYSYLYPRYSQDKPGGRMIIGLAASSGKMFDSFEETEKNSHVIGNFIFAAADFIGRARNLEKDEREILKPHTSNSGLLDITYRKKDMTHYNEIMLGKKNSAYILVQNPEVIEKEGDGEDFTADNSSHLWNWPRHIGKPIKIRVVTSGDIVALSLDGRPVGRKLAGKFNKNIADFKTNYYPGRLEAVSYHKGIEQSRVSLESVTSPKALKLDCFTKSVTEGELCFIDIFVTDKEGRTVPYAMRDVEVIVSGEGEFVAAGNGDCEYFNPKSRICPVYNGVATCVVRATAEGKIIVKVVSEGLLSNKATIKVK